MASRGRGRGRGGWGGGRGGTPNAPQMPFELFPKDVKLPDVKLDEIDAYMRRLNTHLYNHEEYYKCSPYLLEDRSLKGRKRMHIERFSDKQETSFTRDSLSQVLMFEKFPKELVQGTSKQVPNRKKFRWNPELHLKQLDLFEQKEKKMEAREDKNEKEKKDGQDEDEEENAEEEEDEDDLSDDDYNQNEHFDDDEDDFNDVDDGNDEPTYGE